MKHWNPEHSNNQCPNVKKTDTGSGYILNATCIHCLKYALIYCDHGLYRSIENRIKQLTYSQEFDILINENEE